MQTMDGEGIYSMPLKSPSDRGWATGSGNGRQYRVPQGPAVGLCALVGWLRLLDGVFEGSRILLIPLHLISVVGE